MSTSPSPSAHTTGYTTPSYPPISTVSSSSSLPMTTPKPKIPKVNVFSNDGSFLERFHKFKQVSYLTRFSSKLCTHDLVYRTSPRRRMISCNGACTRILELSTSHVLDCPFLFRKRNFDDRFKNRGKRPPPVTTTPSSSSSVTSSDEDGPRPSKRSRSESSDRST